jgi:hypothetical protein
MATIAEMEEAGHKRIRLPWWAASSWLDISGGGPVGPCVRPVQCRYGRVSDPVGAGGYSRRVGTVRRDMTYMMAVDVACFVLFWLGVFLVVVSWCWASEK